MNLRYGCRIAGVALLIAVAVGGRAGTAAPTVAAQEAVALVSGCNNVTLAEPAGTPLRTLAARIQPAGALNAIFRYDAATTRFLGFSPAAPDAVNDYAATSTALDAAFICMNAPGTYTRGGALTSPAATTTSTAPVQVPRGVISAPRTVRRGETVEFQIGTVPGLGCVGGVNIPSGGTFRFVPVEAAAAPNGLIVIRVETFSTDARGPGLLSLRCGDGQLIRVQFDVI